MRHRDGEKGRNKGACFIFLCLVSTLGVSMSAYGIDGVSWKEEVQLHDSSKIVVTRSQSYGGRHEIGQTPPVKEHDIAFTLPGSNKSVMWKDEYSEDVGRSNFNLLALHILNGTPYVVASPSTCVAYNIWGRPNPPYVFFKFDGSAWQRISLSEFPAEFKEINVVISTKGDAKEIAKHAIVSATTIKELNSVARQPEYKTILRTPMAREWCPNTGGPKAPIQPKR